MKLAKTYQPGDYEDDIYALWEKSGAFRPQGTGKSYSMVIPPPNANGDLHLGHGLTLAIEDILIRYHRQKGERVLFVPGADHAGFETQVVYEKELAKEGKSRFDFSREELYQQIWDFVHLNRANFEMQIRKLGTSVDWGHHVFTLDDKVVRQAYATFRRMWDEKLIYRGERLVNFCTHHGTAFADIEVAYKEEKGHLWHINYPLVDGSRSIVVATTRPETMLGDTAVAVHPQDKRYNKLVGKTVKLPLTDREIPIIADEFVDPKFGSGAVKVTPAHDPNDFEIGQRHSLPSISVIDHKGMLINVPEEYHGLDINEGRKKVVDDLKQQGLVAETENHVHSVGHCYKCGTVIQPLLREQWFIDTQPLAQKAIAALQNNEVKFHPANKRQQLITYFEGLKDWNISRQIAWGIPIPAFQNVDDPDDWIYDERVSKEIITIDGKNYRRDPDVFDTWFSSSSWPYVTLSFPDSKEFNEFYPLSVMETAADILYPWVSRMIMFGLYETDEAPFEDVYLHGLIQDTQGQKMSKSKGNVVNPIDKVEQYGSDAFRMGIISDESAGNNRPYDESKLVGARNFANKLWNIARYIEDIIGEKTDRAGAEPSSTADHWVLSKLQQSQEKIWSDLDNYRFGEAYNALYHFVWNDLADWYIEASKSTTNKPLLAYLLEQTLMLAHPFAPFLTETIWQTLAWENDSILAAKAHGKLIGHNAGKAKEFSEVQEIVTEVRFITKALKASGRSLYHAGDSLIEDNTMLIKQLARLKAVGAGKRQTGLNLTNAKHDCWLDIDPKDAKDYAKELGAKLDKQAAAVKQLENRLKNKAYLDKAPRAVVSQTKQQLEEARELLAGIESEKKRFSA